MLDIDLKQEEKVGSSLRLISLKYLVPVDMKMLKVWKNILEQCITYGTLGRSLFQKNHNLERLFCT